MNFQERKRPPQSIFRGRSLGITALTILQLSIGVIHILFGLWLLTSSEAIVETLQMSNAIYDVYTIMFGLLTTIFAVGIWRQAEWGFNYTMIILLFVILVDLLTLLGLPSIPGVPKFAAGTEIGYSVIVVIYLLWKIRDRKK